MTTLSSARQIVSFDRVRNMTLYALGLLALCVSPMKAQTADRLAALGTDSVAWQRVLDYVVSSLASQLVASAADSSAQPWIIRLPANEPQRDFLEHQLRTLFRARTASSSDSVVRTLELGPLVVVRDSGYVRMLFDLKRRCPDGIQTLVFGNVDSIVLPRHPQMRFWGAARSAGVRHGDGAGCRSR